MNRTSFASFGSGRIFLLTYRLKLCLSSHLTSFCFVLSPEPVFFLVSTCGGGIWSSLVVDDSDKDGACDVDADADVDVVESWDVVGVFDFASAGLGRDLFRGSIMNEMRFHKVQRCFLYCVRSKV